MPQRYIVTAIVAGVAVFLWLIERTVSGTFDRIDLSAISRVDKIFLSIVVFVVLAMCVGLGAVLRSTKNADYPTKLGILIVFFVVGSALILIDGGYDKALVFLGVGVAATGWLVQANGAQTLQRRQHTLTVLTEMRQCQHFIDSMRIIGNLCPPDSQLDSASAKNLFDGLKLNNTYERRASDTSPTEDTDGERSRALIYMFNYYEFLAAAVFVEDLDNQLLEASHGGPMEKTYERFLLFLRLYWGGKEKPTVDMPFYYLHKLIEERWKSNIKTQSVNAGESGVEVGADPAQVQAVDEPQ